MYQNQKPQLVYNHHMYFFVVVLVKHQISRMKSSRSRLRSKGEEGQSFHIAGSKGTTATQISLQWMVSHGIVHSAGPRGGGGGVCITGGLRLRSAEVMCHRSCSETFLGSSVLLTVLGSHAPRNAIAWVGSGLGNSQELWVLYSLGEQNVTE